MPFLRRHGVAGLRRDSTLLWIQRREEAEAPASARPTEVGEQEGSRQGPSREGDCGGGRTGTYTRIVYS